MRTKSLTQAENYTPMHLLKIKVKDGQYLQMQLISMSMCTYLNKIIRTENTKNLVLGWNLHKKSYEFNGLYIQKRNVPKTLHIL